MSRFAACTACLVIAACLILPLNAASAAAYHVQPGDSLWSIAMRHGTTVEQLKRLNGLTSDLIRPGQTLQLPPPAHLTAVQAAAGDTMWKIAVRHGVPLHKLIAANPQIADPNIIWPGLTIHIPKRPDRWTDGTMPLRAGTYELFTNTFADSRTWNPDGSQQRTHEGVDILAAEGTPVYSALAGKVVRIGWNEYGGWRLTIRVDSDTDFYYAHLSGYAAGITAGSTVKQGQLIGYVGSTGYGPEGTSGRFAPHLHFGIYRLTPSYHAVDPFLYLKWWEL